MVNASQAFDEHRGGSIFETVHNAQANESKKPWSRAEHGHPPPMMCQLRLKSGERIRFCYSDVRLIRSRDAGHIELAIISMHPLSVTIEGRNLRELDELLGLGLVRWIEEADDREDDRPEIAPAVTSIRIEPYQG